MNWDYWHKPGYEPKEGVKPLPLLLVTIALFAGFEDEWTGGLYKEVDVHIAHVS
jgi:hypothetical protein